MLRKARDRRIMQMAGTLASSGHKVFLFVGESGASRREILTYYGVEDLANLQIIQLPILRKSKFLNLSWNGVFYLFLLFRLIRLGRREEIDLLYLSVPKLASFLLSWKSLLRADRIVYELHELGIYPETVDPDRLQVKVDFLEKQVLPQMDGVITTTEALKGVLKGRYPGLPVAAIPLGTTEEPLSFCPPLFASKPLYRLCYIGQLYEAQGVDLLVRAISSVPSVHLHVIGGEEEQIRALKQIAKELGLLDRITFHGFVPPGQVKKLASDMDIFVLPARNTIRMSYVAHIKIYEYMSYGRPIVATALRSTEEELRDEENAILVSPDDPQELAKGILRLVMDPSLGRRVAAKALQMASSYTWRERIRKIEEFVSALPPRGDPISAVEIQKGGDFLG